MKTEDVYITDSELTENTLKDEAIHLLSVSLVY